MFNKYFRSYPWWMQMLQLLLGIFILTEFAIILCSTFLPKLTGFTVTQLEGLNESSSGAIVQAALLFQAISHVAIFLLPTLLFAYLAHPRPLQYLGLVRPGKSIQLLLVTMIAFSAIPVLVGMESVFHSLNLGKLGKWAEEAQKQRDNFEKPFLNITSFSGFINVFFVIAILPAIGEELLFRGVLLKFAKKRSSTMTAPLIITSLLFALVHFNIYGLVPLFLAGAMLGIIYYLTGSLWCSMLFHLIINGSQIAMVYLGNGNKAIKSFVESDAIPVYIPLISLVVLAFSFYLLVKNQTPLPNGWENDFTPEELEIENADKFPPHDDSQG